MCVCVCIYLYIFIYILIEPQVFQVNLSENCHNLTSANLKRVIFVFLENKSKLLCVNVNMLIC